MARPTKNIRDIGKQHTAKQLVNTEFKDYDQYLDAQKYVHEQMFQKEAQYCTLCGYIMTYNGHQPSEKEVKWSTHDVCKTKMDSLLDRETGVARERRSMSKRKAGRRF